MNFLNSKLIIMLKDIVSTGKKATRDGFGDGLYEAGKANPNDVALGAALVGSLKMTKFIDDFHVLWIL